MQESSIKKKAALWNTAAAMINAGQSALILIFISHFIDHETAGVFTISYALANLFCTMGRYGVRYFQVTDIEEKYAFSDYFASRIITTLMVTALMLVYLLVQMARGAYGMEKALMVLLICLWKMVDAVEDVYYGLYQQRGRLDIGARCYTVRLAVSTVAYCLLILLKLPFTLTTVIVLLVSVAAAALLIRHTLGGFRVTVRGANRGRVFDLLKVCFPLFVGYALSCYLGNSPKYMIDWYLDEHTQAIFGYIMMPTFVILVLSQVIFQPIVKDLGEMWTSRNVKKFISRVLLQYALLSGLTVIIVVGGVIVGIPVLSIFYNTDLSLYRREFALLLVGGGAYALASFIMVPLTTIRFNRSVALGFGVMSVLSLILGRVFVMNGGIMGAAVLYLVLNAALAVFFTVCLFARISWAKKNPEKAWN